MMLSTFLTISLTTQIIMIVIWALIAIVTLIIESETADLETIWFTLASIVALICAICKVAVIWQVTIFAVVTIVLLIATRPLIKKLVGNTVVKTNADHLIGMIGEITKEILPGEKGEVKVDYRLWAAIADEKMQFAVGDKVVVKEIIGNKMVVEPIEEIEIN